MKHICTRGAHVKVVAGRTNSIFFFASFSSFLSFSTVLFCHFLRRWFVFDISIFLFRTFIYFSSFRFFSFYFSHSKQTRTRECFLLNWLCRRTTSWKRFKIDFDIGDRIESNWVQRAREGETNTFCGKHFYIFHEFLCIDFYFLSWRTKANCLIYICCDLNWENCCCSSEMLKAFCENVEKEIKFRFESDKF